MPAKKKYIHSIFCIITTAILISITNSGHAEIYKWTDAQGNVHYSDIKPNQSNSEKLSIKTNKTFKETRSPQDASSELDQINQTALEAQAEKLKTESQKRDRENHCNSLRNNLKVLEENSRIKINENDEIRFLTDQEITDKKADYNEQIQELCSN